MGKKKKQKNINRVKNPGAPSGQEVRAKASAGHGVNAAGPAVSDAAEQSAALRAAEVKPVSEQPAAVHPAEVKPVSEPGAAVHAAEVEPVSETAAAVRAAEVEPAAEQPVAARSAGAAGSFLFESDFDNNSLEDPELHIIPFDRGGVESRRVQDPRLKPHGMPRHKPKAWRDLPIGGKIYKVFYFACLCVFCIAIGMLLARGVAYVRQKAETNKIAELYVRDNDRSNIPRGDSTPVPLSTIEPTAEPGAAATPAAAVTDNTEDIPTATPDAGPTNTPIPLSTPVPKARPSFAQLLGINRDVVGFVELPNTVIRYPVLQSRDPAMPDYYLDHDIYRQHNYYGSIFMSYGCDPVYPAHNTILSGHNMQDGEMFRQISNYTAAYMWKQNPFVLFDTLYESYEWEIFAAYTVNASTETIPITFSTVDDFLKYCETCKQRSVVKLANDVKFSGSDRLLTLITCSYNGNYINERTFAVFRLVWRSGEMDSGGTWRPTTPSISGSWGW